MLKLGVMFKPLAETDLNVLAEYVDTRIDDPIVPLPTATTSIKAALPRRLSRDPAGRRPWTILLVIRKPANVSAAVSTIIA